MAEQCGQIYRATVMPWIRGTNHASIHPFYAALKGFSHPRGREYLELMNNSTLTGKIKTLASHVYQVNSPALEGKVTMAALDGTAPADSMF